MDHVKAIVGNGTAWLAVAASYAAQLLPLAQLLAVVVATAASAATARYFWKKAKKV